MKLMKNIKIKKMIAGVLVFLLLFAFSVNAEEKDEKDSNYPQNLYARGAVLMDASTGRVLFDKNGEEVLPNASTTKILTCIVALEHSVGDLETTEISEYASSQPKVHLGMLPGEHYRVNDLLYSMMLESHNDSAVAIAEYIGRNYLSREMDLQSEQAVLLFVDEMNKKAKEIGCENTYFVTPNGLDATRCHDENGEHYEKTHGTTARDLALIMAYCVVKSPQRDRFLEITGTKEYRFSDAEQKRKYVCVNHNAFLQMMEEAVSGKTGFTAKAGYCYVAAIESEGRMYTAALLACGWPNHKAYKWEDTKKLISYGMEYYFLHSLKECEREMTYSHTLEVSEAKGERIDAPVYVPVEIKEKPDWESALLLNDAEKLHAEVKMPEKLQAPVTAGERVGSVVVYANGKPWQSFELCISEGAEAIDEEWCIYQIFRYFFMF